MLKYRFFCNNKNRIQNEIGQIMFNQDTGIKDVFDFPLHRKGLNFTENTEIVKGFYLGRSEWESRRYLPARVCFRGKYVSLPEGEYIDFYIYPQPYVVIISLLAILFLVVFCGKTGVVSSIIIFLADLIFFTRMIKHASEELKRIFLNY